MIERRSSCGGVEFIMGLFLALSGVVGGKKAAVEDALRSFATLKGGSIRLAAKTTDEPNALLLLEENSNVSILYPRGFLEWDEASKHISAELGMPVFSLHIHDGDFWMFVLYDRGQAVDQFNPLPEYWSDDVSVAENPERIAACIPGSNADVIKRYLRHWDLEAEEPGKAFPSDQFGFNDC
jgi:hypothetical protein